jgi:uncharacterized membrane protein
MRKWYPMFLAGAMLGVSAAMYPKLPERIPTHWNIHGQIDSYGPKNVALFLMPLVMVAILGIMRALPKIDPRKENYARMAGAYDAVVNAAITVMAVVHVATMAAALGMNVSMQRIMPAIVGIMLIVVGNVLPQARPNWFFGIRTPWTLSNDRVWERTHRVGGYLFVIAGVAGIASVALPFFAGFAVLGVAAVTAAFGSIIYSYVVWKDEKTRQEGST